MKIADAEFGALDVNGEVNFAASGEILDVTVSTVLGTSCSTMNKGPDNNFKEDVPGIVLAPSLPTFALISSEAEPA
jgi:hypothetical protein